MDLPDATAMLGRTPNVLFPLLDGVPDEWLHRDDGPGTWSAYAVVGHLLHADTTNWLPRIRTILEHGTERAFAPFDREAMLGWERQPVTELLDRFRLGRAASLDELAALQLTRADLDRRGAHPQMGEVTLGHVISAWVAHDLTHVAQVNEVLAGRYRADVGPFRQFMPGLDRFVPAE